jgi:hypothetical protein
MHEVGQLVRDEVIPRVESEMVGPVSARKVDREAPRARPLANRFGPLVDHAFDDGDVRERVHFEDPVDREHPAFVALAEATRRVPDLIHRITSIGSCWNSARTSGLSTSAVRLVQRYESTSSCFLSFGFSSAAARVCATGRVYVAAACVARDGWLDGWMNEGQEAGGDWDPQVVSKLERWKVDIIDGNR